MASGDREPGRYLDQSFYTHLASYFGGNTPLTSPYGTTCQWGTITSYLDQSGVRLMVSTSSIIASRVTGYTGGFLFCGATIAVSTYFGDPTVLVATAVASVTLDSTGSIGAFKSWGIHMPWWDESEGAYGATRYALAWGDDIGSRAVGTGNEKLTMVVGITMNDYGNTWPTLSAPGQYYGDAPLSREWWSKAICGAFYHDGSRTRSGYTFVAWDYLTYYDADYTPPLQSTLATALCTGATLALIFQGKCSLDMTTLQGLWLEGSVAGVGYMVPFLDIDQAFGPDCGYSLDDPDEAWGYDPIYQNDQVISTFYFYFVPEGTHNELRKPMSIGF